MEAKAASPLDPRDVRPATRRARIGIGVLVALALAVAVVSVVVLLPWYRGEMRVRDADGAVALLRGAVWTIAALQLFVSLELAANAWRCWTSGEWPPPRAWVLRDTPIVRGAAARRRAVVAAAIAALALVLAVGFVIATESLARDMLWEPGLPLGTQGVQA